MTRLETAVRQIEAARIDTMRFLDTIDDADWFRQPFTGANHVAWQVGHLAIAEYGLVAGEVLGCRIGRSTVVSADLQALFRRGSTPQLDQSMYPLPSELRSVFQRVHEEVLTGLVGLPDDRLEEPAAFGHPLVENKLDALHLCARHEAIHTGQIAMLRRAFGAGPLR